MILRTICNRIGILFFSIVCFALFALDVSAADGASGNESVTISFSSEDGFSELLDVSEFSGTLYGGGSLSEDDLGVSDMDVSDIQADMTELGSVTIRDLYLISDVSLDTGWYALIPDPVETEDYVYQFKPSVSHITDGSGEFILKPERTLRTGSIRIEKRLSGYDKSRGDARFVFSVDAEKTLLDGTVCSESRTVDLFFTEDGVQDVVVDGLPYGAMVHVEEVYSGAGYDLEGDSVVVVSAYGSSDSDSKLESAVFRNKGVPGESYGETVVNRFVYEPGGFVWNPDPEPEEPVRDTPKTGLASRAGSFLLISFCLIGAAAILYGIRKGGKWGRIIFGVIGILCLLLFMVAVRTFALPMVEHRVGDNGSAFQVDVMEGRALREYWSEGAKHAAVENILDVPVKARLRADHAQDVLVEVLESSGWRLSEDGWCYWDGVLQPGHQTDILDISIGLETGVSRDFEVPVSVELMPE